MSKRPIEISDMLPVAATLSTMKHQLDVGIDGRLQADLGFFDPLNAATMRFDRSLNRGHIWRSFALRSRIDTMRLSSVSILGHIVNITY